MQDRIKSILAESADIKRRLTEDEGIHVRLSDAVAMVVGALRSGRRLWFCGNGGSAADAQHLAAEFSGRFYRDRRALPAEALHCNSSYMTAVANDYGYEYVYSRIVDGVCEEGDVLVGLSTSGNSANIIMAFESARVKGVRTIGFTGAGGGRMASLSDILLDVPSTDTPRIQEAHILMGHILCQLAEEEYFTS
jgi:D-sedoheptulose 7-phosphate isomerase